jgi:hypothetical protein
VGGPCSVLSAVSAEYRVQSAVLSAVCAVYCVRRSTEYGGPATEGAELHGPELTARLPYWRCKCLSRPKTTAHSARVQAHEAGSRQGAGRRAHGASSIEHRALGIRRT